eukprot:2185094-Amphidinium_carterae.1
MEYSTVAHALTPQSLSNQHREKFSLSLTQSRVDMRGKNFGEEGRRSCGGALVEDTTNGNREPTIGWFRSGVRIDPRWQFFSPI